MQLLPVANIVIDTFVHGGLIMWPLLVLSLLSLAVIVERLVWSVTSRRARDTAQLSRVYQSLSQGREDQARDLASRSADPRLRVIAHSLDHVETDVDVAIQVRADEELKIAKRFLTVMDTIITLAPLLGLLGTVTGIMQSFKFVGGDQELAAAKVSGGIGEALIATAFGLGVAIITLVPFNTFGSRAEELRQELEVVGKNVHLLLEKGRLRKERDPLATVGSDA